MSFSLGVSCGKVNSPVNGLKNGNTYTYPSVVNFQCLPGHYMTGIDKISCQASGRWSSAKPLCIGILYSILCKLNCHYF